MKDPLYPASDGQTLLSDEDRRQLVPTYISTRGDLDEAEQANILKATVRKSPGAEILLDDKYLRSLHRAMFDEVWRWAGKYRRSETNIGIDPSLISGAVRDLVADVKAWVEYATYEADEIGVRFHHRLVAIHPFPNGNGRHSRIAADYLIQALGRPKFSWGINLGLETQELRSVYRQALIRADNGDIEELLNFARS